MRYQEIVENRIDELFQNTIPYNWTVKSDKYWEATFDVEGTRYLITATREDDYINDADEDVPYWELSFGLQSDGFSGTRVIGTNGNELAIFATVLAGFKEILVACKPDIIGISASKENSNRFKLYQHLAKRMSPELSTLGYQSSVCPAHRHVDTSKYFDSICYARQ